MKKYKVTVYYQTHIEVSLEASSEDEAVKLAYIEAGEPKHDNQFLNHAVAADYSEVEEIKED